jgi:hypothetical protein
VNYKDLMPEEKKQFCEFLQTMIIFSDEQYEALSGEREMTSEIFESCLNTCAKTYDLKELNAICEQYPRFAHAWAQKIDSELRGIEVPSKSEEEKIADWNEFKAKLHSRYGIVIG